MRTALISAGTLAALGLAAWFSMLAYAFTQNLALTLGFMTAIFTGGA